MASAAAKAKTTETDADAKLHEAWRDRHTKATEYTLKSVDRMLVLLTLMIGMFNGILRNIRLKAVVGDSSGSGEVEDDLKDKIFRQELIGAVVNGLIGLLRALLSFQKDEAIRAGERGEAATLRTITRIWYSRLISTAILIALYGNTGYTFYTVFCDFAKLKRIVSSVYLSWLFTVFILISSFVLAHLVWLTYHLWTFYIRFMSFNSVAEWWVLRSKEPEKDPHGNVGRCLSYELVYQNYKRTSSTLCEKPINTITRDELIAKALTVPPQPSDAEIRDINALLNSTPPGGVGRLFVETLWGRIITNVRASDTPHTHELPQYEANDNATPVCDLAAFTFYSGFLFRQRAYIDGLVQRIYDLCDSIAMIREVANDFKQSTRPLEVDIATIDILLPHVHVWNRITFGLLTLTCVNTHSQRGIRCLLSALFLMGMRPVYPRLQAESLSTLAEALSILADSETEFVNRFVSCDLLSCNTNLSDEETAAFVAAVNKTYRARIRQSFPAKQFSFSLFVNYLETHCANLVLTVDNMPSAINLDGDVAIERIWMSPDETAVLGRVRVRNIAFDKDVVALYTFDNWQSTNRESGTYTDSEDAAFDRFSFSIPLRHRRVNVHELTLSIAVQYSAGGRVMHDTNGGHNYQVSFTRQMTASDKDPDVHRKLHQEMLQLLLNLKQEAAAPSNAVHGTFDTVTDVEKYYWPAATKLISHFAHFKTHSKQMQDRVRDLNHTYLEHARGFLTDDTHTRWTIP